MSQENQSFHLFNRFLDNNPGIIFDSMNNLPVGTLLSNRERMIYFANDEFCRIFSISGYETLIGAEDQNFIKQSKFLFLDPSQFLMRMSEIIELRQPVKGEEIRSIDGRVLERSYTPMLKGGTELVGHLWQYCDVTQIRNAERMAQVLSLTLENISDGIVLTDREGVILMANHAFTCQSGYTLNEVVGKNPKLWKSKMQDRAFYKKLWNTIEKGDIWEGDLINLHKNGFFYPERMKIVPVQSPHSGIAYFVAVKKNINTRAEKANIEKIVSQFGKILELGRLTSSVAHEINNFLTIILGFTKSISKDLKETDPLFSPMKSIDNAASMCHNLVQNILSFSRSKKVEKEKNDLNRTINDIIHIIEAGCKNHCIELKMELEEGLPQIKINGNQIQQVVINLCINAIHSMNNGGTLTVRTKKVEMKKNGCLSVEIQDTGHGIPEEIKKRIFEPFFSTKEENAGTGLGLSIVQEIVKEHLGIIEIESQVGAGTLFRILLPLNETPLWENVKDESKECIVIVEDELDVMGAISRALSDINMKIVCANDSVELGKILQTHHPKLIIVDVMLPYLDGFNICKIIRDGDRFSGVKILAISGHQEKGLKEKIIKAGANNFLAKPFRIADLRESVNSLICKNN